MQPSQIHRGKAFAGRITLTWRIGFVGGGVPLAVLDTTRRYTSLTPEGVHASGQHWLNLQTSVRVDIEAEERRDDGKTTDEGGNKR